jgi:hypothetical protein
MSRKEPLQPPCFCFPFPMACDYYSCKSFPRRRAEPGKPPTDWKRTVLLWLQPISLAREDPRCSTAPKRHEAELFATRLTQVFIIIQKQSIHNTKLLLCSASV